MDLPAASATADAPAPKAKGKHVAVPERLALPAGAKACTVKLETFAKDARFVTINVSGTLQLEHALSLLAMLSHDS
jgi:hypothetical protein